ncbi:MAG: PilT/PilU family type 4a pilus ATPase [Nitrospirae bacterium]|nr:PilT/PilU family type 4a pilus ATPase [Nitrospirota bacterium]
MKAGKGEQKQRLGELLVEHGLINTNQLKEALKRQVQVGGQIGSILVEMGFISIDDLLDFLSRQLGVPSANLFKLDVPPNILRFLPLEKIKTMKVVPLAVDDNSVTLAMVNPSDMVALSEIEFSLGKKVQPVVVPAVQMETAIKSLMSSPEQGLRGAVLEKEARKAEVQKAPDLLSLLRYLVDSSATDMLLTAGVPPSLKIHNDIIRTSMATLTPVDCERYAREMMSGKDWEVFLRKGDKDFAVTYPELGRFRVSVYKQRNSVSVAIRHIADIVPTLEELMLPGWLKDYALKPQGLILVSGPAGHGKTTTVAAMIDIINTYRKCNIVTLEDPIEYLHKHKNSNVNQREVGLDTESFHEGLKRIFRQYPDVIVIGELRDKESFEIALQAADTGHLVLCTVHSNNSTTAIERVINMFPPHQQNLIRTKLADTLLLVLSQRLVARKDGEGRVLAYEKLINSYRIKNLIREEKTHQIRSQMQTGTEEFSSIDSALASLYKEGLITFEDGLLYAENEQFYREIAEAV